LPEICHEIRTAHRHLVTYALTTSRPGFVELKQAIEITLAAGQKLDNLALSITPESVITGRIRNADGDPVSGVAVDAVQWRYRSGTKRLVRAARQKLEGTPTRPRRPHPG